MYQDSCKFLRRYLFVQCTNTERIYIFKASVKQCIQPVLCKDFPPDKHCPYTFVTMSVPTQSATHTTGLSPWQSERSPVLWIFSRIKYTRAHIYYPIGRFIVIKRNDRPTDRGDAYIKPNSIWIHCIASIYL